MAEIEYPVCCSLRYTELEIENNNDNNNVINKQLCCTSNEYGLIFYANKSYLIILSTEYIEQNKNFNNEICKINFDTNIIQINISSNNEYIGIVRSNCNDASLYIVETYDLNKLIRHSLFERNCINSIDVKKDSINLTISWSKKNKMLVLDKDCLIVLSPSNNSVIRMSKIRPGYKCAAAWHHSQDLIIYCENANIYIYDIDKNKELISYLLPSCTESIGNIYIISINIFLNIHNNIYPFIVL